MTSLVSVTNLALQKMGTQTTITSMSEQSNEAIQSNLAIEALRDELLRMAPWDCALNFNPLAYITSTPGTPENSTVGTETWQKGQPAPPWAYEYQYPVDCLRACYIVPQFTSGFASGIPITTAITGAAPAYWNGPPVRFKVGVDQFLTVASATVAAGGTGYAVNDVITLDGPQAGVSSSTVPNGAPAVLLVATLSGSAVATVVVDNQVLGEPTPIGGSYFTRPTNPVAQGSTTGSGTGATFNLTFTSNNIKASQRVIWTNQQQAILAYVKRVTDPNVMDPLFLNAWSSYLASRLAFQLSGDKALANMKIQEANAHISLARGADANEGLQINDVTPDWIRIRGINFADTGWSPNQGFDWGALLPLY